MASTVFQDSLKRLRSELKWLEHEYLAGSKQKNQLACEMVIVRMHDCWARFCREAVVLSASGRITTLGGIALTSCDPNIKGRNDVIPILLSKYSRRRQYEPKWAQAVECIGAARHLNISNLTTFSAAIGAVNSPAESIRYVRNFYSHRKKSTAKQASSTGVFSARYPNVFDLGKFTAGGVLLIESWTIGLVNVGVAALQ
jgi:hypothetical protein